MPNPFKVDSLNINPSHEGTRSISSVEGELSFKDLENPDGLLLRQLANLSNITNLRLVGKEGEGCQYTTIQEAINSIPLSSNSSNPFVVLITSGVYSEDLSLDKDGVTFIGLGTVTIRSLYDSTPNVPQAYHTLHIYSDSDTPEYVCFRNITFRNSHDTKACVFIEGGANSDIGLEGVYFYDCRFDAVAEGGNYNIKASSVNSIYLYNCNISSSDLDTFRLEEVAFCQLDNIYNLGAVSLRWDEEEALPSNPPDTYQFNKISSLGLTTDNTPFQANITNGPTLVFRFCEGSDVVLSGDVSFTSQHSSFGNFTVNDTSVINLYKTKRGSVNTNGDASLDEDSLKGTLVFDDEDSKTFSFPIPKQNTDYFVGLVPYGDTSGDVPYVSAKDGSGFTVSFNNTQTLTLGWYVND